MKILGFALLGSLFFSAYPAHSATKTFQYLARVPEAGLSCNDAAKDLESKFASREGVRVSSSECRGLVSVPNQPDIQKIYSILVSYEAERAVYPTSITIERYDSYEHCVNRVLPQRDLFEAATGLASITAMCLPSRLYGNYQIEIQGLGKAKARLYNFQTRHPSQALALINRLGAVVAETINYAGIYYYSENSLILRDASILSFPSIAACENQLNEGAQMLTRLAENRFEIFCRPMAPGNPNSSTWLTAIYSSGRMYSSQTRPEQYFSMNECLSDKQRILDEVRGSRRDPIAAFCTTDIMTDMTKLEIFYILF